MQWPDVRPVAIAHLLAALGLPAGRVALTVPGNVETLDRFVRIVRGPGSDDEITDSFLLDVETFTQAAATSAAATASWSLAEGARQAMHSLAGTVVRDVLIDSVTTATSPTEVDYGNPGVVRFVASYRVELRKVA